MHIWLIGYPGDMGGANTEAWHTCQLWRRYGLDVHLIPTWGCDPALEDRLNAIGCLTHHVQQQDIEQVPDLAGSVTVGMCNHHYMNVAGRLRKMGCKIVWVNCMTFLFDHETRFFAQHGPADAMVYQSDFQRSELEPKLQRHSYRPQTGHLIHGAFDFDAWPYQPRPHQVGEPFVFGRVARPDQDKWSSNLWPIYTRISHHPKQALVMGANNRTLQKLGKPPPWAKVLKPMEIPIRDYWPQLHCCLTVNGGALENWSRIGLEAMATGVPVVAQAQWGWREMIDHGRTGFLADSDEELAHYATWLAYDEPLRLRIAQQARQRLVEELANPDRLWAGWQNLFVSIGAMPPEPDTYHTYHRTSAVQEDQPCTSPCA